MGAFIFGWVIGAVCGVVFCFVGIPAIMKKLGVPGA